MIWVGQGLGIQWVENGGILGIGRTDERDHGMESGLPIKVFGRDVVVARGVGGNVVGTDGVLSSETSEVFVQRSTVMG